jgi:hypothetical protein
MFSFLPGALPQATVKVAFGQNLGPQLRNSEDIRRLASKDAIAGRPHQRRSGSPTSPACQPGRHAAGILSARTFRLTRWRRLPACVQETANRQRVQPVVELAFRPDSLGNWSPTRKPSGRAPRRLYPAAWGETAAARVNGAGKTLTITGSQGRQTQANRPGAAARRGVIPRPPGGHT